MRYWPGPLARLIEELEKMPGIGPKTAQRLALYIIRRTPEETRALSEAITQVSEKIQACPVCFNFTDQEICAICSDDRRNKAQICVVADPRDVIAMENTGEYRGVYHVLQGVISPMEEVGPESLTIDKLMSRLRESPPEEVILATNPTVEGDATALYLAQMIKPLGVKVTRIALGLPVGGDLDYADQVTVARSLINRTEM